ncbi:Coenzyme PQQ synthesis protein E [uncultured archaeon]|nr:Coenzyme PQQ synthesis protein E [uncultured archaeon]
MMRTLKELCLEIISTCPLRCIHCSNDSILQEELKFGEISLVIDDFKDLGGQILEISGGEPLEHADLLKIIRYSKAKGLEVRMYTSGLISKNGEFVSITDDFAKELKNSGLDKIIFNIEGSTSTTHELFTGLKGSYEKEMKSISVMISSLLQVGIHFVPTKLNFKEIRQVVEISSALGVSEFALLRFVPQGRGLMNREKLELSHQEYEELFHALNNIKIHSKIRIGHPLNCFISDSESSECIAGKSLCLIRPNGDVVPCPAFKQSVDYVAGNINKKPLINIWNNSEILEKLRTLKYENIAGCRDCTSLSKCQGGCTAQRILTWGDFYRGCDPACPKKSSNPLFKYKIFKSCTTELSPSNTVHRE